MTTQGISQACKVALGMIIVRMLAKEEVGTYRQAFLVYTFLASLLSLHLDGSLYYFVPRLRDTRLAGFLRQTFVLTALMGGLIAVMMYLGAGTFARILGNDDLVPLVQILCLYPFGEKLLLLVPSFMISRDRAVHAGLYTVAGALLRIALVAGILKAGGDLASVFTWLVAATCGLGLIGAIDMYRFAGRTHTEMRTAHFREQLSYCLPLLVNSAVAVANLQFDKFLISHYFDAATFAVYSCGAMDLPMITLITSSLGNAIMPNLVQMAHQGDHEGTIALWQKAMRKSALAIFPCFVFFMVVGRDFMVLLYGDAYAQAAWPFRIYLLGLPIRIAVYSALLRALGHTRPIAISALVGLVSNVGISIALIVMGGGGLLSFNAPEIGTIVSYFAIALYCLWVISSRLKRPIGELMRWGALARLLAVCAVAGLPPALVTLPHWPLWLGLPMRAVLFAAGLLAALLLSGELLEDERRMLRFPLRRFLGRGKGPPPP